VLGAAFLTLLVSGFWMWLRARRAPVKGHWEAVARANAYVRMGRPDRALEIVSEIRDEAPGAGEAMAIAGFALVQFGEYRAARLALKRAIELQPNQFETAIALADINLGLGDGRRGLEMLQQAARLRPREFGIRLKMGKVLHDLGDLPRAIQAYEAALALDPGDRAALRGLIKCLLVSDQSEEAEGWLCRALARYPDDSMLLGYAARAALDANRLDEAIARADQALAHDPANIHALVARARVRVARARWQDALRDAELAVAAEPSDPSSLQLLLKIETRLGLTARAAATRARGARLRELVKSMDALGTQIALHPDDPTLVWKLGECARESESYLLASRCFVAALALDPNFQPARDSLAQMLEARPDLSVASRLLIPAATSDSVGSGASKASP
jgi:tetratricopeptide (TPR) repeat protein